jgi:hypothetical protein
MVDEDEQTQRRDDYAHMLNEYMRLEEINNENELRTMWKRARDAKKARRDVVAAAPKQIPIVVPTTTILPLGPPPTLKRKTSFFGCG